MKHEEGIGEETAVETDPPDDRESTLSVTEVLPGEGRNESNVGPKIEGRRVVPALVPEIRGVTVTRSFHASFLHSVRYAPGTLDVTGAVTRDVKLVPMGAPVPVPPGRT